MLCALSTAQIGTFSNFHYIQSEAKQPSVYRSKVAELKSSHCMPTLRTRLGASSEPLGRLTVKAIV